MTPRTDNEVNEAFAKAIGWKHQTSVNNWMDPHGVKHKELPNWCQDFPAFKRDVIGRMEEEGVSVQIVKFIEEQNGAERLIFTWAGEMKNPSSRITDKEILRAGVESAAEYLERRKGC